MTQTLENGVGGGNTMITRFDGTTKVADVTSTQLTTTDVLDLIYPIGAIAIGAKPSIGTWEKIEGRFLLGSSSAYEAGATGGEENHTLTINEMPSHSHTISEGNGSPGSQWSLDAVQCGGRNTSMGTNSTGGGRAHNNMPPYIVVDMWRRTA